MKKILFLLLALPLFVVGQQKTYVPDDAFEDKLEQGWGSGGCNAIDGIANNDSVLTSALQQCWSIVSTTPLIQDITGIEDIPILSSLQLYNANIDSADLSNNTDLKKLYMYSTNSSHINISGLNLSIISVWDNQLSELDVSSCTDLEKLWCGNNNLTYLDLNNKPNLKVLECDTNNLSSLVLSNSSNLEYLDCSNNQITNLDISNTNLSSIFCSNNQLTELDLSSLGYRPKFINCSNNFINTLDFSNNTMITTLDCSNNPHLHKLNIKNTFNYQINPFIANNNPNLYCIQSDYVTWQTQNWTDIDNHSYFSQYCNYTTSLEETKASKNLTKITNVSGQEITPKTNTPLFYLFDNGTVEKQIIIE
jgi:Leucine-rich repeat (LRR) protein